MLKRAFNTAFLHNASIEYVIRDAFEYYFMCCKKNVRYIYLDRSCNPFTIWIHLLV
jgi:hypothetical protein